MNFIRPPKAPNLPLAPSEYERGYTHQINDVLRLYFTTIDNAFQALFGSGSSGSNGGGQFLKFPYGAFSDYTPQSATVINTPYKMTFNTTDYTNGVTVVTSGGSASRITVANTGLYNLQWSGQFQNTAVQDHDASVWIRKNGTDVTGSTGYISIPSKHGGVDGHIVTGWNYFLQLTANDYVELWWSTDNLAVTIHTYGAGVGPSTASLIATLSFVSAV
jgi:hypothetical protein